MATSPDTEPGSVAAQHPFASREPDSTPTRPSKRQRTSQACENCRSQKTRCIASEVAGICERCLRTHKECKLHVPIQQNHESRGKRRSLARIESRIEELYSIVGQKEPGITGLASTDASPQAGVSHAEQTESDIARQNRAREIISEIEDFRRGPGAERPPVQVPQDVYPFGIDRMIQPDASNCDAAHERLGEILVESLRFPPVLVRESFMKISLLLTSKADELLNDYRSLSTSNFPFVIIPSHISPLDLLRTKPLLAAAIFAAMSAHHQQFQAACDDVFRAGIMKRCMQEGEKSLEAVQALLVYLGYHHHYFKHETQQAYSYINLASSIAVEIGLTKPLPRTVYPPTPVSLERLRALLGLYYLNTLVSGLDLNRPRVIRHTSVMISAADTLAAHATSTQHFPALVSLMKIAEDILEALRSGQTPGNVDITVAHFLTRLSDWDRVYSTTELTFLTPTRHFLTVVLHESVLFLPTAPPPFRINQHLNSCLAAARLFLDGTLASPTLIISLQNMPTFTHIGAAITALIRLCRSLPTERFGESAWGPTAQREAICAFEYLGHVIGLMKRQEETIPATQRVGLSQWFERIGRGMALWLVKGGEKVCEPAAFDAACHFARVDRRGQPATSDASEVSEIERWDANFWNEWMWDFDLGLGL